MINFKRLNNSMENWEKELEWHFIKYIYYYRQIIKL